MILFSSFRNVFIFVLTNLWFLFFPPFLSPSQLPISRAKKIQISRENVKPDQSFADDFLFPMTSRLSYASSPESDGEFCEADNSISRMTSRNPSISHDAAMTVAGLARSNSDPNLARDQDDDATAIPDYNAPPPYAINASQPPLQTNVRF